MTILSIVGARPQFVKAFPVSRELRESSEEVIVHTGQHYDDELSAVFFRELNIPEPDYHLGIGSGTHATQTAEMMMALEPIVEREQPDGILVYGDTNSTLAGALVAAKTDATLAHVEAGLRSHNWSMPEEVNRVLTDHCADLLLAPTAAARENLAGEGITDGVHVTGDVMYDAVERVRERARAQSTICDDLELADGEYVLATVHRAGNTNDPERLAAILAGLASVDREVVFPVHPRTANAIEAAGLEDAAAELRLVDPVGYVDFVRLIDGAERVATDSGGVQKEAFFLDTRCITLREETEWVETVDCGWNVLVGADEAAIERELRRDDPLPPKPSLYGDGTAARAVVDALVTAGIEGGLDTGERSDASDRSDTGERSTSDRPSVHN